MRAIALLMCLVVPVTAQAQEWKLRNEDQKLSSAELADALIEQKIVFFDNGESKFARDGGYSYTYDQGGTAYGEYRIGEDSIVCIDFANGFSRCDMYVRNGERLVLLTENGLRFPIRPQG